MILLGTKKSLGEKDNYDIGLEQFTGILDELLKSKEVMSYITQNELEHIFNSDKILKNVDYIFQRSIYSKE